MTFKITSRIGAINDTGHNILKRNKRTFSYVFKTVFFIYKLDLNDIYRNIKENVSSEVWKKFKFLSKNEYSWNI